jgi:hypothetical protein
MGMKTLRKPNGPGKAAPRITFDVGDVIERIDGKEGRRYRIENIVQNSDGTYQGVCRNLDDTNYLIVSTNMLSLQKLYRRVP